MITIIIVIIIFSAAVFLYRDETLQYVDGVRDGCWKWENTLRTSRILRHNMRKFFLGKEM